MFVMNTLRWTYALCVGLATAMPAMTDPSPIGLWKTVHEQTGKDRSLVRISEHNGVLSGHIEKVLDSEVPADARCVSCTGALQGKPVIGLPILSGLRTSKSDTSVWEGGEILDPVNGKTFKVKLTLTGNGHEMQVRGFVGSPLLGRTQVWVRAK